jgi:hypothetical protein
MDMGCTWLVVPASAEELFEAPPCLLNFARREVNAFDVPNLKHERIIKEALVEGNIAMSLQMQEWLRLVAGDPCNGIPGHLPTCADRHLGHRPSRGAGRHA